MKDMKLKDTIMIANIMRKHILNKLQSRERYQIIIKLQNLSLISEHS